MPKLLPVLLLLCVCVVATGQQPPAKPSSCPEVNVTGPFDHCSTSSSSTSEIEAK